MSECDICRIIKLFSNKTIDGNEDVGRMVIMFTVEMRMLGEEHVEDEHSLHAKMLKKGWYEIMQS